MRGFGLTVSAVTAALHGTVVVDGTPQSVNEVLGKDVTINTLGETITLGACTDTNGNTSIS
ncbi:MAG: hypothetical protein ABR585_14650 [Gemmatimonadaceae bacterium]